MRHFKKRTVALCLASVITVLGSFAANMYTNNILDLRVNNPAEGFVSIIAITDKPYTQSILTDKINDNVYSITFPSTNSIIKQMPDIKGCRNIEAIHVATHPGTPERPGFTKVFLKTVNDPNIAAKIVPFINDNTAGVLPNKPLNAKSINAPMNKKTSSYWDTLNYSKPNQKTVPQAQNKNVAPKNEDYVRRKPINNDNEIRVEEFPIKYNEVKTETSKERWIVILGVIIVFLLVFAIFFFSKDKMVSVVGEQNDFDLDEEENEKKKKHVMKDLRKVVNNLDNKYKNKSVKKGNKVSSEKIKKNSSTPVIGEQEDMDKKDVAQIIDLDKLFNEKTKTQDEKEISSASEDEHDDLAEFLSEFSFNDEIQQEAEKESSFDEELFETTIHSNNMNFSKADKDRLAALMRNEISDELMDNVAEFVPSEPKQPEKLSERAKLENLLFDYTTKQDLYFTQYDVDTIKKLMNVEMESSFISDLQTDSERTEQVQKELEENKDKPHQILEDIVLNVKDFLPNLSEELAKQGNKRIESEAKPEVVYYSEGYEVSKLSVSDELADISKALESENKTDFRPSDDLPIVENGYEVETLSVGADLPDLSDVKAHPHKYEEKKTKAKIDENDLLKSIANVKFKPFYEDTNSESNMTEELNSINDKVAADIKESISVDEEKDMDIDAVPEISSNDDDAKKLIKIIEAQQAERQKKKVLAEENENLQNQKEETVIEEAGITTCRIDSKRYNIIKTVSCDDAFTCCLACDENGYDVIGERNGAYQLLRHYDSLKSENLKTRVNEKNVDGSVQYLIRIGINKFVVNVTQTGMEFVMDLC